MGKVSLIQTSFNAGELSPRLDGRVDFQKYASGCRSLQNMLPVIQGGAFKRSGTVHVNEVADSDVQTVLIPFSFGRDQAYVLEFGNQTLRIFANDGPVVDKSSSILSIEDNGGNYRITTDITHGVPVAGGEVYITGVKGDAAADLNDTWHTVTVFSTTVIDIALSYKSGMGGSVESSVPIVDYTDSTQVVDTGPNSIGALVGQAVFLDGMSGAGSNYLNGGIFEVTQYNITTFKIDVPSGLGDCTGGRVQRVYQIDSPYESVFDLNKLQWAQSADVLFLAHPDYPPYKLERTQHTAWAFTEIDFDEIPFQDENQDLESILVAVQDGTTTGLVGESMEIYSTAGIFTSEYVGEFLLLRETIAENHAEWGDSSSPRNINGTTLAEGHRVFWEGNVYKQVNSGSGQSWQPPIHLEGTRFDGSTSSARAWEYIHSGYGVVEITAYTNANSVTATVIKRLPLSVQSLRDDVDRAQISTWGAPAGLTRITTVNLHQLDNNGGDEIIIRGVTGNQASLYNNKKWTQKWVGTGNFDLWNSDGTTGTNSGGTILRPAGDGAHVGTYHWAWNAWSDRYGYPRGVTFFEDRLWWAGTNTQPQTLWGSRTGEYENHRVTDSSVEEAESAVQFTVLTDQVNVIEWISAGKIMAIGTAGGEYTLSSQSEQEAVTAGNVKIQRQSTYGSRTGVPALRIDNVVMIAQQAGRKLREFVYDFDTDGYVAPDMTALSDHILKGRIQRMAFAQEPDRHLWVVLEDGSLVCFTYDRPQQVVAWHRHVLGGTDVQVKSLAVIPHQDGTHDQVWFIVSRTINGGTVQHVEYLEQIYDREGAIGSARHLDAHLVYSGGAATTIYGLWHLIGESLDALADNLIVESLTVSAQGTVTLTTAASDVVLGLPYTAIVQTMRLDGGARDGASQGKWGRVTNLVARLEETGRGLSYGPDEDTTDPYDITDGTLFDGDTDVLPWPEGYEQARRVTLVHDKPTPFGLIALMPQLHVEDR